MQYYEPFGIMRKILHSPLANPFSAVMQNAHDATVREGRFGQHLAVFKRSCLSVGR
jgi:hypothetical protein